MNAALARRAAKALTAPTLLRGAHPSLVARFRDDVAWAAEPHDLSAESLAILDLAEIELDWGALPAETWEKRIAAVLDAKDDRVHVGTYMREGHLVQAYERAGHPADHFPHLPHLTFRDDVDPPRQEKWRPPPPPQGKRGQRKAGGYAGNGQTNTEIGDLGEALASKLDFTSVLPPGRRQNPLDVLWDDSRWGFEVKTVTTRSVEYKVAMKTHEVEEKRLYAAERGLRPALMMLVFDTDEGQAHAYWREGIANGRLNDSWNYAGSVNVADLEHADATAQQAQAAA